MYVLQIMIIEIIRYNKSTPDITFVFYRTR